jgi:hypothetical protein
MGAQTRRKSVMSTFAANAVRLQLHALAYNLGNFMRTLAMPKAAAPRPRRRLMDFYAPRFAPWFGFGGSPVKSAGG